MTVLDMVLSAAEPTSEPVAHPPSQMALLLDTEPLLAALDAADAGHER